MLTYRGKAILGLVSTAIRAAMDELLPPFERANGHIVRVSYGPLRRADPAAIHPPTVLMLSVLGGLNDEEIAQTLAISQGNAKVRLHRARSEQRAVLSLGRVMNRCGARLHSDGTQRR